MVDFLTTFLPILVNILLVVLIIIGIILGIRFIQTLNRVDKVVDDVNDKIQTLNGFFNLIDYTTDKVMSFTDTVVDTFSNLFGRFFKRRHVKEDEEE